ncbi:PAS domain-containing sensor histidine kinase [Desertivirga xinjiangensis]|uniref:PAS domain-containing sensor histidine kinase n=1 Tax=Desertivirga xinjiangensis TaxID=539206 RepID=UPI00210B6C97|nr:PAS domain-containing sensor histidine kinase [Pedobacter xinjiangensis]
MQSADNADSGNQLRVETNNPNLKGESFNWEMTEVLNNINIGFFSRDIIADKYINLSEGCPKIYGYTLDDFFANSKLWYDVIYPADKVVVEKEDAFLLNGQKCVSEYRIVHKDGSLRWLEVKAIPVIQDGVYVRVDGIVSDITDRKTAELEVIRAKELTEIIMNSLPGIFYLYNEQGEFIYWNQNLEIVTGYSTEEIFSLHPLDLFVQEDKELLAGNIVRVFEKGTSEVEARLLTKDGQEIPYYCNGRKVKIGDTVCLVGMGLDITERKKAAESLQKNEEMLSHILNSIPQSIFWKDKNSVFLGGNTVFAHGVGLKDVESIVGKTDFDLPCDLQEAHKYQKDDQEIMASGQPRIHYIETQQHADGEVFWIDTTKIPLKDSNNNVYGVLGIYDDITERKVEEERQKKVTADLIQKNIGLRQFSYIVSHNLRSPISKILGLASLFEKEDTNPINQELIEYLVNEVSNLDTVVKDLNTIVSCHDSGNQQIEQISLIDKMQLIQQALGDEIMQTGAQITWDFSQVEKLRSLRAYFYSIMFNLISNAIKYKHPDRPLKIHVESGLEADYIYISVKDNGLGIDLARYGTKIFGLYNRFHTGNIPGKGIGLNLVKTQAETLGGRVELESTVDEGTTFRVYLPKNE